MGHITRIEETATAVQAAGLLPLSAKLKAAIETPMISVMSDEHGFDLKPGAWKLPAQIDQQTQDEAAAQASIIETVQMRTAETDGIRRWLIALGNAVAASSSLTETDVQAKVGVLVGLLDDYPAGVFTKASLKRAATRFRFFPAFAELSKLLDEEARDLRVKRDRLLAIARANPPPVNDPDPDEPRVRTPEQIAAAAAMVAKVRAMPVVPQVAPAGPGDVRPEQVTDTREAVRRVAESAGAFRRVPKPWERAASSNASTDGGANG